jgi:UDP-N-acetylmuramate--alanine ligase
MNAQHFHFIGVGGAGMSGIARIMLAQGSTVSGSDVRQSSVTQLLETLGAKIFIGHSAENQQGADFVVVSSAIAESNPELLAARNRGAHILPRAEALAEVMKGKKSIAVAGTHGKTTTTSMLTVALQSAGQDPSFAIGGMINNSGTNAHWGTGDIFVAEADESDGSFLAYKPFGAVITNIELDHVDHFSSLKEIIEIFERFINSIQPGGFLVVCGDDENILSLLSTITRRDISIYSYGESNPLNDFQLSRILLESERSTARLTHKGTVVGDLELEIPGKHNLLNATAVVASTTALGISQHEVLSGITDFRGARRRFELQGNVNGIRVVDDYGHHPTEVRVTLETARRYAGAGRVFVIFQPHRYTRTQMFSREFGEALELADQIYLLEVYAASEESIPGVSSTLISKNHSAEKFHYQPSMIAVIEEITSQVQPLDVVLTLGAGDVNSLGPVLLTALRERFA